jgi:hypothetical protein
MEDFRKIDVKPYEDKTFFSSWRFWKPFLAVVIGAIAGYLYYHFVGCTSGQCAITSNPYMSTIAGGFLGLFIVNSPCARGRC